MATLFVIIKHHKYNICNDSANNLSRIFFAFKLNGLCHFVCLNISICYSVFQFLS